MAGYIENLLLKFKHGYSRNVQSSPYKAPPKIDKRETPAPITLKGCIVNLSNVYIQVSPFPRISNRESPIRAEMDRVIFPGIRAHAAAVCTNQLFLLT